MVLRVSFVVALVTALIGFASSPAAAQSARTFYIDYAGGSNANNGTSKSTPWKTHPYMQASSACTTGSVPAYSHVAGDRFIFKGGATWPAACFQMAIGAGGTPSAQDYYGVDLSWFAGGSFTRPLFDLTFNIPTNGTVIQPTSAVSGYMTFDNLEIAHQGIALAVGGYGGTQAFQLYYGATGSIIKNCFIHDWATASSFQFNSTEYSAGGILSGSSVTVDHTEISDAGGYGFFGGNKVFVGFGGACENCGEVKNSKIHDTMAACFSVPLCHDNELYNIKATIQNYDGNVHTQVIEDNAESIGPCGGYAVYNNIIHDNDPVGVTILICYNSSIYNNVMWNNGNIQIMLSSPSPDSGSNAGYVDNNTVYCPAGACYGKKSTSSLAGTVNLKNNHWIADSSPGSISAGTLIQSNNITMPTATASAQGYTISNRFAPTSGGNGTVNAAVNLSGLCSGALSSLCSDVLHSPRLTSWDAGAYQFGSASTKPAAPSNLFATVQ